jgi:hypothetical protein
MKLNLGQIKSELDAATNECQIGWVNYLNDRRSKSYLVYNNLFTRMMSLERLYTLAKQVNAVVDELHLSDEYTEEGQ